MFRSHRNETQTSVTSAVIKKFKMALRVEVRFIDEWEFQNKGKWYLLSENPKWGIDSMISLDSDGSPDEISDLTKK